MRGVIRLGERFVVRPSGNSRQTFAPRFAAGCCRHLSDSSVNATNQGVKLTAAKTLTQSDLPTSPSQTTTSADVLSDLDSLVQTSHALRFADYVETFNTFCAQVIPFGDVGHDFKLATRQAEFFWLDFSKLKKGLFPCQDPVHFPRGIGFYPAECSVTDLRRMVMIDWVNGEVKVREAWSEHRKPPPLRDREQVKRELIAGARATRAAFERGEFDGLVARAIVGAVDTLESVGRSALEPMSLLRRARVQHMQQQRLQQLLNSMQTSRVDAEYAQVEDVTKCLTLISGLEKPPPFLLPEWPAVLRGLEYRDAHVKLYANAFRLLHPDTAGAQLKEASYTLSPEWLAAFKRVLWPASITRECFREQSVLMPPKDKRYARWRPKEIELPPDPDPAAYVGLLDAEPNRDDPNFIVHNCIRRARLLLQGMQQQAIADLRRQSPPPANRVAAYRQLVLERLRALAATDTTPDPDDARSKTAHIDSGGRRYFFGEPHASDHAPLPSGPRTVSRLFKSVPADPPRRQFRTTSDA